MQTTRQDSSRGSIIVEIRGASGSQLTASPRALDGAATVSSAVDESQGWVQSTWIEEQHFSPTVPTVSVTSDASPDWTQPTWIEQQYGSSTEELVAALRFFGVQRTEAELSDFLTNIPPSSGLIHPLLGQFQSARNQEAVLFLLLCPKREERVDMDTLDIDPYSFTLGMVHPMGHLIRTTMGKPAIGIDFRKQCRRVPKDDHCARLTLTEIHLYTLATRLELLIARNVFGISFTHSVAWSQSVIGISNGLDMLMEFPDATSLMGHVSTIPVHPRHFCFLPNTALQVAKISFEASMRELVSPVLAEITRKTVNEIENFLFDMYSESSCVLLKPLFSQREITVRSIQSAYQKVDHSDDKDWREINRPLLAAWAILAQSPEAATFVEEGRLPSWYLRIPRQVQQQDSAATSISSASPILPAQGHTDSCLLLDPTWVLAAPLAKLEYELRGLVGARTQAVRDSAKEYARNMRANWTPEEKEAYRTYRNARDRERRANQNEQAKERHREAKKRSYAKGKAMGKVLDAAARERANAACRRSRAKKKQMMMEKEATR